MSIRGPRNKRAADGETESLRSPILVALVALVVAGASLVTITSPVAATHGDDPIIVAEDGSGNFTTIQDAIDHAGPGDTIQVEDGTYQESISIVKTGLTIEAADGHSPEIRWDASDPAVAIEGDGTTIDGLQITKLAEGASVDVRVDNVTLQANTISAPDADADGIVLDAGIGSTADLAFADNTFADLVAAIDVSDVDVEGLSATGNTFNDVGQGGLVIGSAAADVTFHDNEANGGNALVFVDDAYFHDSPLQDLSAELSLSGSTAADAAKILVAVSDHADDDSDVDTAVDGGIGSLPSSTVVAVPPQTFQESVTIEQDLITLCASNADHEGCLAGTGATIDGSAAETAIGIQGNSDVVGLDIVAGTSEAVTVTSDVDVGANIADVTIDASSGGDGIVANASTGVIDSELTGSGDDVGILGNAAVSTSGTHLSGFSEGIAITDQFSSVEDSVLEDNGVGIQIAAENTTVSGTTFEGQSTGVLINPTNPDGDEGPTNVTLRHNELGLTNSLALDASNTLDAEVDARLNYWGVVKEEFIADTRVDGRSSNTVQIHPYLDELGDQHPPRPDILCTVNEFGQKEVVGSAMTLQRAIDATLPSQCVDHDEDGDAEREIHIHPDYEEYHPAVVDKEIELRTSETLEDDEDIREATDLGALVEATDDRAALNFIDGSQGSLVSGVGILADGIDTTGILLKDIQAPEDNDGAFFHSAITLEHVGLGTLAEPLTDGIVIDRVKGVTLTSSTVVASHELVSLVDTSTTTVSDNRLIFDGPGADAGAGIVLNDTYKPTVTSNKLSGPLGSDAVGIDAFDTTAPEITDNVIANVGQGIVLAETDDGSVHRNQLIFPPAGLSFGDGTAIDLVDGQGHTLINNTVTLGDTGLSIDGTTGVEADWNRFNGTSTGVIVDNLEETELDGEIDLALTNGTKATTVDPLVLTDATSNLDVDATCNDWGVYHSDLVDQRTSDDGTNNEVDVDPFTSPNKDSQDIECLAAPRADFSFEPEESITRLDTVEFFDESKDGTYEIESWSWDFDNGNTSDAQNPTQSFDDVGEFFVELTVSDQVSMEDTIVRNVTVENLLPELLVPSQAEVPHNKDLSFEVSAQDPENDDLTFDAHVQDGDQEKPLPAGAEIVDHGDGTATFEWNASADQFGSYDINVTVNDGYDTVGEIVDVTIINEPPEFPDLPAVKGGAEERRLLLDVVPEDPEGDEIVNVTADLSALPSGANYTNHGDSGTLDWTPSVGDAGNYTVSFTAETALRSATVDVLLAIREDNLAPTVNVTVVDAPFLDGEKGQIWIEAQNDTDSHTWNFSVATPEDILDEDTAIQTDGNTALWTWDIPANQTGTYNVTVGVDDGFGTVTTPVQFEVEGTPWVDARLPIETETGRPTLDPLVGSNVLFSFWAEDPDELLAAPDMSIRIDDGTTVEEVNVEKIERPLWGGHHSFDEPGIRTVTIEVTDGDNHTVTDSFAIDVKENDPPEISLEDDLLWRNATDPSGAFVELTAEAEDPEGRQLNESTFTWELEGAEIGDGPEMNTTLPVGTHHVDVSIADPFGLEATETVTVHVDDSVIVDGELDAPKNQDGYYEVDPVENSFEKLEGSLTVSDDLDQGVAAAQVTGTVTYYGAEANNVGITTATFDVTTDSNGEAEFSYEQEILSQSTALETSWLSAPGWHEIRLDTSAPSRAEAPLPDAELGVDTIRYFVGPSTAGETGAHASAACYDGPASDDGRSGAEDEARATVTASGNATAEAPDQENVTEGAGTFADQGGDCARGYGQASLILFDTVLQACYDGEVSVHVSDAPCPENEDGVPLQDILADDGDDDGDDGGEADGGLLSAGAEGACFVRDKGGQDEAQINVASSDVQTATPELAEVATKLADCAVTAAQHCRPHHECPTGGSFLAVTGSASGDALVLQVDTVPATDFATGQTDDPGATGVEGQGACYYDGNGAQDSASVFLGPPPEAGVPNMETVAAGLTACGDAVANGDTPEGGSHARFTATVAGSTVIVSADTVPISDAIT